MARYISSIMLILVLITTMMPFFAVYNPKPNNITKEIAELFGNKILICTGDGFKWINLADLEKEKKHIPSNHYKCPLCYIASHVPSVVLSNAEVFFPEIYGIDSSKILYGFYNYNPRQILLSSDIKTRAPPFPLLAKLNA